MLLGLTSEDADAQMNEHPDMKPHPQRNQALKPLISKPNEQNSQETYEENEEEFVAGEELARKGKPVIQ